MTNYEFRYSAPIINDEIIPSYNELEKDKLQLKLLIEESNSRVCLSDLCKKWKKDRPSNSEYNLLLVLYEE